jgi:endonuclease YncB( thermonuclease family)
MARTDLTVPQTYAALRAAVETVVLKGREGIERAWVQTYHDTGRLITEHLVVNKNRTGYGTQVLARLSADTHIDKRTLQQCAQFYRYFPKVSRGSLFSWAHYRALCQVDDTEQRNALYQQALREEWTSPQLLERVRVLNARRVNAGEDAAAANPPKLLTPRRGTPGVCRVIADGAGVAVDLGFACYLRPAVAAEIRPDDFVKVTKTGIARLENATKADLFTYHAEVVKVVDGDTLWVRIFLRPDQWVKQKLRLRDLDCPELATPEGKAAKRFVDALMAQTEDVTICTTKPDKYDRYLADVFLALADGREVYLNNELLAHGHAGWKRAWEFGDWE